MSKGKDSTQTTTLDPQSAWYVQNILRPFAMGAVGIPGQTTSQPNRWGMPPFMGYGGGAGALGLMRFNQMQQQPGNPAAPFAMPPLPPGIAQAQQQYGAYGTAGQQGLQALTGGPNPFYDATKTAALDPIWSQQRAQALQAVGDQAQGYGAYGGSRQGVAEGAALAQVGQGQAAQQYQAYLDSLQRAMAAANLGFGATAQGAMLPGSYYGQQLGLLTAGMGPYGQTQTTHTSGDPFSQLLGIGAMFLPGGPLAGLLAKGGAAAAGTQVLGGATDYGALGFA